MADQLLKELGIADGVTLQLNTLGDAPSREAWRVALVEHFRGARDALSEDSQERLEKNPLRILDSKDPRDKALVARGAADRRFPERRGGADSSRRCATGSMPRAWRGTRARRWCAGSTTTATPRSNSSPTGWARRGRCSAAGATTG